MLPHRSRTLLALLAVAALPMTGHGAVVYKWTDADGVVHFSDQPVPGAEKVTTAAGTSRGILSQPAPRAGSPEKSKPPSALAQTQVAITSPTHDQTFTGDQPVGVRLSIEPELKPGQTVSWILNGTPVNQAPDATNFTLTDLARGTYTLDATVTDPTTGETKSAESVTFNVIRPSLLSPLHK
ncbi:MAG TPA: DUF4124 domain-containing protein [Steroidobacteraceae bacterium]|nr:DUF4124 domain-containing protein [Steroidobacteraceae bacterium]